MHVVYPFIYVVWEEIMLLICLLQEKQRVKVKEKIDKCVKEKLMDFCDVLNIPINKSGVKKVVVIEWHLLSYPYFLCKCSCT